MIRLVVLLTTICLVGFVIATNYCSSNLCSGGSHIGCNNKGTFGTKCPSTRSMVNMTPALRNAIVNSHNTKRNTLASGRLSGFKSAARMATIQWNNELAILAEFNAKRCIYGHDQCHNTDQFRYSGQNIAKNWWSGGSKSDSSIIIDQVDAWWAEYKDTTMAHIKNYPSKTRPVGHFTVMAADKNIAVGCAAIKYRDIAMKNWNSLTFVCNYATTNMIGRPIYASGGVAAKCSTGRNPNYSALCSTSEQYDLNKF